MSEYIVTLTKICVVHVKDAVDGEAAKIQAQRFAGSQDYSLDSIEVGLLENWLDWNEYDANDLDAHVDLEV